MRIRFGTSGWRGIIAREFTWERVDRILDAIALHILEEGGGTGSAVVGGDCRFLSPELAVSAAERLAGYGLEVVLADRPTPTPVLSHACRSRGLGGVVNFTASHNPPLYNGIKFSPAHGGPAGSDVTGPLEGMIAEGARPPAGSGSVTEADLVGPYAGELEGMLDLSVIRDSGLRVVYDAFSGTGAGLVDRMLIEAGAAVRVMNGERDPLFAGRQHPEPGEAGTRDLGLEVERSGASLGVATDGDADRFGIVDGEGRFVSPHDFLPLVLSYLVERGGSGLVVRSVTTGGLLDRVASSVGLETAVTPVGFKHLGSMMLREDVLLAGEESGGMSIGGHVPEKDGILACLLACEMACAGGGAISEQLERLWSGHGRLFVTRRDVELTEELRSAVRRDLFDSPPMEVAGRRVREVDRTDGVRFVLGADSWVLLRLSGTEPLVRVYAQAGSAEEMEELLLGISGLLV